MTRISVCIATYNGEKYIKEQLDSILLQLNSEDEVIISDDESTDRTIDIINEYRDRRIILLNHIKRKQRFKFGYTSKNIEYALERAKGRYIILADQDDIWLPNKINEFIKGLQNCDALLSNCSIVDDNLNVMIPSKIDAENIKIGDIRNIFRCGYLGCCMAFKSEMLRYILPLPNNVPHDLWIGLVCNNFGILKIQKQITLLYRRHSNNVTAPNFSIKQSHKKNSLLFKIKYRLFLILPYLKLKLRQL